MELKKDNKGISLLSYSAKDIQSIEKLLSEIPGVYDLESITLKDLQDTGTTTHIFKLKLSQIKFKILVSEDISELMMPKHPIRDNETLSGCHYAFGMWVINSGIGRYTPIDIQNIIRYIHDDSEKYQTKEQSELLDKYISTHIYEDYNDESNSTDTAGIFAHGFLTDNHISDNRYHTTFLVLNKIFFDRLNQIEL